MTSKRQLITLESGDVIVIRPPVYSYLGLFVECYLAISQYHKSVKDRLHPYWDIFLKLILDPVSNIPKTTTASDAIKLIELTEFYLFPCELPDYPKKKNSQIPQPKIIGSGDDYCDELAMFLKNYPQSLDLFNQLDRSSIYRINHQLSQLWQWEQDQSNSSNKNVNTTEEDVDPEMRKKLEGAVRGFMCEMIESRGDLEF